MNDYKAQLDEIREEAENPPQPAEGEEAEELEYDPNFANYRLYLRKYVGEVEIAWNNQIEKVGRSVGWSVGRSTSHTHTHAHSHKNRSTSHCGRTLITSATKPRSTSRVPWTSRPPSHA